MPKQCEYKGVTIKHNELGAWFTYAGKLYTRGTVWEAKNAVDILLNMEQCPYWH